MLHAYICRSSSVDSSFLPTVNGSAAYLGGFKEELGGRGSPLAWSELTIPRMGRVETKFQEGWMKVDAVVVVCCSDSSW